MTVQPDTNTRIEERLREEWDALGCLSLHAHEEQNEIWWADLTKEDIHNLRDLIAAAASENARLVDRAERAEERAERWKLGYDEFLAVERRAERAERALHKIASDWADPSIQTSSAHLASIARDALAASGPDTPAVTE